MAVRLHVAITTSDSLHKLLGKTFMAAKHVDVVYAIQNYRYYAGWADKNQGKTIEVCLFTNYKLVSRS